MLGVNYLDLIGIGRNVNIKTTSKERGWGNYFVKIDWSRVGIFSFWSFWDEYIFEFRMKAGSFFV